jgi:SnoaL-like domain
MSLSTTDLAEIQQTLALFGHIFDAGDFAALDQVFSDDVVVQGTIGRGYTVTGIDACREFTRNRKPDTPDHNMLNTIVFVDDDGIVRVRSRYIAPLIGGGVHSGDHFDIVTRTPEGWRISYLLSVHRNPASLEFTPPPESFTDAWHPRGDQLQFVQGAGQLAAVAETD